MSSSEASNDYISDFLLYYIKSDNFKDYAVMIDGPWGVGKTRFIKDFINKHEPALESGWIYISLFGLKSFDDIDDEVFRAIYTRAGFAGMRFAGRIVKAAGNYFGVKSEFDVKEFLSKDQVKLYIFDDLERCDIPPNQMLGYINQLVEQGNNKVIAIANQLEIQKQDEYVRRKEKIFAKIFQVKAPVLDAIKSFAERSSSADMREFYIKHLSALCTLHEQSGSGNLRIIQQAMSDFERLYTAIDQKYTQNDGAMLELMRITIVYILETKLNRLAESDVSDRVSNIVSMIIGKNNNNSDGFIKARERYVNLDLSSGIVSDQFLVGFIFFGEIDLSSIENSLRVSSHFTSIEDEPEWKTVWHAFDRSEEQFYEALHKMNQKFQDRKYDDIGVLLHVIGLRIWLSKIDVIDESLSQIVDESISYIHDLYSANKLLLLANNSRRVLRFQSYDSLGIFEKETEEYKTIVAELNAAIARAKDENLPSKAKNLMKALSEDQDLFYRKVVNTYEGSGEYCDIPILKHIDPAHFSEELLKLHPGAQGKIFQALESRYNDIRRNRDLQSEISWAADLRGKLLDKSKNMTPIRRYTISRRVNWSLEKPFIDDDGSGD
jgi:hypothetical protein